MEFLRKRYIASLRRSMNFIFWLEEKVYGNHGSLDTSKATPKPERYLYLYLTLTLTPRVLRDKGKSASGGTCIGGFRLFLLHTN